MPVLREAAGITEEDRHLLRRDAGGSALVRRRHALRRQLAVRGLHPTMENDELGSLTDRGKGLLRAVAQLTQYPIVRADAGRLRAVRHWSFDSTSAFPRRIAGR